MYQHQVVIGAHGGRGYEHCFRGYDFAPGESAANGDAPLPNSITRLTYNQVSKNKTNKTEN